MSVATAVPPDSGRLRRGPLFLWAFFALVAASLTTNPGLTLLCVLTLVALIVLLWRPGEPAVLLFFCGFQWLEASLVALNADFLGVDVRELSGAHSIEPAIYLSLAWVTALALGMRLALAVTSDRPAAAAMPPLPFATIFQVYVVWSGVLHLAGPFATGGLFQVAVALSQLRWCLVFALFAEAFRTQRNLGTVAVIFLIEVVLGFLSFFSDFKIPIFVLALAVPAGNLRLKRRHVLGTAAVGALALFLAIVWSAIKVDYRNVMSGGTGEQRVSLTTEEQFIALSRLVSSIDGERLSYGTTMLVNRIAYVEYFAFALDFVPSLRPHEDGLIWAGAIRHVFVPRLLFPDKPPLESDTLITERYTGLHLYGFRRNTSIALGTAAETYVDFAPPLMFVPALCLGFLCALAYRWALGDRSLIAMGTAVAILLPLASIGLGPTKILGGMLANLAVAWALRRGVRLWLGRPSATRATA